MKKYIIIAALLAFFMFCTNSFAFSIFASVVLIFIYKVGFKKN